MTPWLRHAVVAITEHLSVGTKGHHGLKEGGSREVAQVKLR